MSETNQNEEAKVSIDVLRVKEDENTYINSSKERMYDVVNLFVNNAENSISLNDFSQIFKTVTVWLNFSPRNLGTYFDVLESEGRR